MRPYLYIERARGEINIARRLGRAARYLYLFAWTRSRVRIGSSSYEHITLDPYDELEVSGEEIDVVFIDDGEVEVLAI